MNKKTLLNTIIIISMLTSNVIASTNYSTSQVQANQGYKTTTTLPALKGQVVMVPAQTVFRALTTSELSSSNLSLGEKVTLSLSVDFYYKNTLIAGAGSQVTGNVVEIRKAGRAGKNGQLKVRFTNIITPHGQMIPISAVIKTDDGKGLLYAASAKDTSKDYAKDLGVGAGAGAALGTAMGALSDGSVGKGAIYGTAIGAGIGLGKSLWDKGQDVVIPVNSQIEIETDQPITVNSSYNY